jgi:hypothetical protein
MRSPQAAFISASGLIYRAADNGTSCDYATWLDGQRTRCFGRSIGARAYRIPRHRLADDIDLHFHPQLVLRTSSIGAGEGNCLARITRDRDADEIAVSDDAVGGIEFDPAGAGR